MKSLYANRGRAAELVVEMTLRSYAEQGIALIQKIPTPWVVTRRGGAVTGAFPAKKSTVDYFLERFAKMGGVAGVLAWFYAHHEFWWLPTGLLLEAEAQGARSLSLARIRETAMFVPQGPGVPLDLLSAWMRIIEGGSVWKTTSTSFLAANG